MSDPNRGYGSGSRYGLQESVHEMEPIVLISTRLADKLDWKQKKLSTVFDINELINVFSDEDLLTFLSYNIEFNTTYASPLPIGYDGLFRIWNQSNPNEDAQRRLKKLEANYKLASGIINTHEYNEGNSGWPDDPYEIVRDGEALFIIVRADAINLNDPSAIGDKNIEDMTRSIIRELVKELYMSHSYQVVAAHPLFDSYLRHNL